jgi:hypothetical protein
MSLAPALSLTRMTMRRRLTGTLALILLVGLTGGAVLAAAAGARRTATAFPRMIQATRSDGVLVSAFGPGLLGLYQEVERMPQVLDSGKIQAVTLSPVAPSGAGTLLRGNGIVSLDGRGGYTVSGFKLLSGRLPNPDSESEILLNEAAARAGPYHVGQRVPMRLFDSEGPEDPLHIRPDEGVPIDLTIVGIGIAPEAVVVVSPLDAAPSILLTPAFWERYGSPTRTNFDGVFLRVQPGTDVEAFREKVEAAAVRHPESGGQVLFLDRAEQHARIERAIRPQAAALTVFAVIAALASLLVLGQAISRHLALDAFDHPVLRSIGATRRQLVTVALIRVGLIAAVGALVAIALAYATSTLMPIGPARVAEPHPGFAANVAILAVGGVAIIFAFLAWAFLPALSAASVRGAGVVGSARERSTPSAIEAAVRRTGFPPVATVGVRMALEPGRGRSAVPVRSALTGTALAVAVLVGSLVFGGDLNRMVSDPRAFGWDWDVMLDTQFGIVPSATLHDELDNPDVEAWAGGVYGAISIAGRAVPAIGLDSKRGAISPTLLDGRAATTEGEIVLGPRTLREVGAKLGDRIDVSINSLGEGDRAPILMKVVGVAVFPSLGRGSFSPTSLGDGAFMVAALLGEPELSEAQGGQPGDIYNFALVRFAGDAPAERRALGQLMGELSACADQECGVIGAAERRPADISNYSRVRGTQMVLALLLFGLASLTVGHTLVTTVLRRRADLAVLKTLGFSRAQLSWMVAWQASTYAVLACAVGVPAGVVLGRWAWITFAEELGVPPSASFSGLSVALPLIATLVLANIAAALPARVASRVRPAVVLRTE